MFIDRLEQAMRIIVIRYDGEGYRDGRVIARDAHTLIQGCVSLLFVPPQYFRCRLDQRGEGVGVERLWILLVTSHRPRSDKRRFRLAILEHGDRPAFIVFVLDDPCSPAVVLPKAVFVNDGIGIVV